MTVPKAPGFSADIFSKALYENIKRPDGQPYAVFQQFKGWKLWNDQQRDHIETNRRALVDHKTDIDEHSARLNDVEDRLALLEATPATRFP